MNSASLSQVLLNPLVQLNQKGAVDLSPNDKSFANFLQKKSDQQLEGKNQLGTTEKAAPEMVENGGNGRPAQQ